MILGGRNGLLGAPVQGLLGWFLVDFGLGLGILGLLDLFRRHGGYNIITPAWLNNPSHTYAYE